MFAAELEKIIPDLRAYARMLCGDAARADDIVQNACLKAWDARASFAPEKGSLKGWMMTITRNEFLQDVPAIKDVLDGTFHEALGLSIQRAHRNHAFRNRCARSIFLQFPALRFRTADPCPNHAIRTKE